ncbi:MAG TPA: isoprenylcysteine carboxylmethyltransferase family protein [Gammaproteobacteria bacterium]|nr:isoprenylcysteine carboxylmethyltransferase family protein [Gammaproteobacteria bacterium]
MVGLGNFFFRWRTSLSPLLLLLLLIPGPAMLGDPFVAAALGLAVACAGQVVRAATIGYEYIVRGGRNHRVYADTLVTQGLFRHTRNPMYVGKFFMVLGAGIASNRWPAMLAIAGAYAFMYQAVTLAEEDYLRRKFGPSFDEYCRRVPRWLPTFRGLGRTLSESAFRWRRVVVKEYSAPLGWTLPIAAIGLYNMAQAGDLGRRPAEAAVLYAAVGAALALWLVAGFLKRTHSPVFAAER